MLKFAIFGIGEIEKNFIVDEGLLWFEDFWGARINLERGDFEMAPRMIGKNKVWDCGSLNKSRIFEKLEKRSE